jgi:hypothetical protein
VIIPNIDLWYQRHICIKYDILVRLCLTKLELILILSDENTQQLEPYNGYLLLYVRPHDLIALSIVK